MRAAPEQFVRQRETERACAVEVGHGVLRLAAQHVASVARRDEAAQPQPVLFPFGIRGERGVTAAAQRARERALRGCGKRSCTIGEQSECAEEKGWMCSWWRGTNNGAYRITRSLCSYGNIHMSSTYNKASRQIN